MVPHLSPSLRIEYNGGNNYPTFYWQGIRGDVKKELPNCNTCQRKKRSTTKNDKFPPKLADKITCNKLYVDLICPYKIRRKGKDTLILKSVTMIDPVTGWFEITQYNNRKIIRIANLVETT